jgi:hydrogenase expression/formation protein HypC
MCLAIPARVVERRSDDEAVVDLAGVRKAISLALVPEAAVGDYVIVHVGYAIGRLDADEAERTLALFAELAAAGSAEMAALAEAAEVAEVAEVVEAAVVARAAEAGAAPSP